MLVMLVEAGDSALQAMDDGGSGKPTKKTKLDTVLNKFYRKPIRPHSKVRTLCSLPPTPRQPSPHRHLPPLTSLLADLSCARCTPGPIHPYSP